MVAPHQAQYLGFLVHAEHKKEHDFSVIKLKLQVLMAGILIQPKIFCHILEWILTFKDF